jgi:hypothetical protein
VANIEGRNAPCHCGSGRKYKRCCYAKDAAARRPAAIRAFSQSERNSASELLYAAVLDDGSPFCADAALGQVEFFGEAFARVDEGDRERAIAEEPCAHGFIQWLALDRPLLDEHTICRLLLKSASARISSGQRTYLERMSRSRMGVYEVREVRRDVGLTLVDLWNNEVHEVSERLATHSLVRYDVVGARLMEGPLGATEIDGAVYAFSQDDASGLVAALRSEWKRRKKKEPAADEQRFLKREGGAIINQYWVYRVFLRPLPRLSTTDGEALEFCTVVFDVKDAAALRAAFDREPALEADDEGAYTWLEPAERRILGNLKLSAGRLEVETISRDRAERAKGLLETIAGKAVRHRLTKHVSPEQALAEYRERPPAPRAEDALPPELEREIISNYQTEYYRRWLDEPIPALGDRTPRHAAKLKTWRPKVITLLKDLERMSNRSQAGGRPSFDAGWMWKELGLDGA